MIIKKNHAIIIGLLFLFIACSNSQENIKKNLSSLVKKAKGLISDCVFGVKSISYILYTRNNESGVKVGQQDSSIPLRSGRTVFVIHGFTAHVNDSGMYELINTFLKKEDINVFSVDWDNASCSNGFTLSDYLSYGSGVKNVPVVGQNIAEFSVNLALNHEVSINETMLIGHSLGAHIAAFAGKHIQRLSRQKYSMIIGLDSAGPGYFFKGCDKRLCNTDATYVMGIHTSKPLGLYEPIGHADFYFNGGNNQPGCTMPPCSHNRAVVYAINFIHSPNCYLGTRWPLGSGHVLSTDECDGSNCAYAGLNAVRENARGIYYVKTRSNPLYCNA